MNKKIFHGLICCSLRIGIFAKSKTFVYQLTYLWKRGSTLLMISNSNWWKYSLDVLDEYNELKEDENIEKQFIGFCFCSVISVIVRNQSTWISFVCMRELVKLTFIRSVRCLMPLIVLHRRTDAMRNVTVEENCIRFAL